MLAPAASASYAAFGGARSFVVEPVKTSKIQQSNLPWAALIREAMNHSEPALFWRVPESGLTLLGIGQAAEFTGSGIDAMTEAQRWVESYAPQVERDDDLPLCWFSSTFDHQPGRRKWSDWPGLRLVVPRILVAERDGQTDGVVFGQSQEELELAKALFEQYLVESTPGSSVSAFSSVQRFWAESPDDFTERVAQATRLLGDDLHKVVLANCCHHRGQSSPLEAVIDNLINSDRHGIHFACTQGGESVFAGCTPETLVQQNGAQWSAHVLAGTRPRNQVGAKDELLSSAKDLREHELVATGMVEALDPLVDTLDLPAEPKIRSLDHLYHLERRLEGRVHSSTGFLDLVGALHPTPALGGYPQLTAVDYLRDCEPLERGGFGAPFGWISGAQDGHAAVAIRSALLKGNAASIFAGAGIVAQSDPQTEQAEVAAKVASIESELLGLSS